MRATAVATWLIVAIAATGDTDTSVPPQLRCCPIGDVRVFDNLHTEPTSRGIVAAWFKCVGLRVPSVLVRDVGNATILRSSGDDRGGRGTGVAQNELKFRTVEPVKAGGFSEDERLLLRAIGSGTRLEIVRYSSAVCSAPWNHTEATSVRDRARCAKDGNRSSCEYEQPLSFSEAGKLIACRPDKSSGVLYALWDLGKVDEATGKFHMPAGWVQTLRDVRNSVASIRASRDGSLVGITIMIARPSKLFSGEQMLEAAIDSLRTREDAAHIFASLKLGTMLQDLRDLYHVQISDIPALGGVIRQHWEGDDADADAKTGAWSGDSKDGGSDLKYAWKLQAMRWSPYHHTLMLDSDTYVCAHSLSGVWTLTQRFDLVATHAAYFFYEGRTPDERVSVALANEADGARQAHTSSEWFTDAPSDVPATFVQLNTAVLAFAR